MPICPFCFKSVAHDAAFCHECGKSLQGVAKCPKCGAALAPDAIFCNRCGASCEQTETAPNVDDDIPREVDDPAIVENYLENTPPQPENEPEPQQDEYCAPSAAVISQREENIAAVEVKKQGTKRKWIILSVVAVVVVIGVLVGMIVGGFFGESAAKTMMVDSRDGQKYRTVKIGQQIWMAENLNYAMPRSWCYEDDSQNCQRFGRLYAWNSALKACPEGWSLPSKYDWESLRKIVESEYGVGEAGRILKSGAFSAQFGGDRFNGRYQLLEKNGYYWSSTEIDENKAFDYVFLSESEDFIQGNEKYAVKGNGFSVRCKKSK